MWKIDREKLVIQTTHFSFTVRRVAQLTVKNEPSTCHLFPRLLGIWGKLPLKETNRFIDLESMFEFYMSTCSLMTLSREPFLSPFCFNLRSILILIVIGRGSTRARGWNHFQASVTIRQDSKFKVFRCVKAHRTRYNFLLTLHVMLV